MRWLAQGWATLRQVVGRSAVSTTPRGATASGPIPGYVAGGHWRSGAGELDPRLELLVSQLSAELSGCCWCIEQGRHRWRKALLPSSLLRQVRTYRAGTLLSERECAALALAEAVARYSILDPAPANAAVA